MKKVLIMVLSSPQPPFDALMRAQKETWDSITVPDVSTIYYYGDPNATEFKHIGSDIICPCSDIYEMMHWKYKLAVDRVLSWDWDFIFRTNSSSYVHKQLLLDYIQTLSTTETFISKEQGVMSGCGFILSRDLVTKVNAVIDDYPTPSEDQYIATMLGRQGYGIGIGGDRVEVNHYSEAPERECYHYRCKSDNEDRTKDVAAFRKLFKQFHGY